MDVGIAIDQAAIIIRQQIGALVLRKLAHEIAPRFGEDRAHAVEEPVDLGPGSEKDSAEDEAGRTLGMLDAVGECQRAAPRPAEQQPALEAEMGAQFLHVGHEVIGRVVLQVAQRHRAPAATLVEHDDSIELRVEEAAMDRRGTRARSAMQEDDWHALGIATLFPIDRVTPIDGQHSARVGRNLREEVGAKRGFRAWHADDLGDDPIQSLP